MSVKIYYSSTNRQYRMVKSYLESIGVEYDLQRVVTEPFTVEQVMEILSYTENGVEDIISNRSDAFKKFQREGVRFSDMSLKTFCETVVDNPTLLRSPITVGKGVTLVGYNTEDITVFVPREDRKKEREKYLARLKVSDIGYNMNNTEEMTDAS